MLEKILLSVSCVMSDHRVCSVSNAGLLVIAL